MTQPKNSTEKTVDRSWYKVAALFIFIVLPVSCSTFQFSSGISGQVIDDRTGQGIPGVIVVRKWKKEVGVLDSITRKLTPVEVLSDEEGNFKFGWKFFFSPGIFPFGKISETRLSTVKPGYKSAFIRKYRYDGRGYKKRYGWLDPPLIRMIKVPDSYSN